MKAVLLISLLYVTQFSIGQCSVSNPLKDVLSASQPNPSQTTSESPYVYDEAVALHTVRYASAAYCGDEDRLSRWDCESCSKFPNMKVIEVFQNPETAAYGFVGVDEVMQNIVVAFRGTIFTTIQAVVDDLEVLEEWRW